MKNNDRIKKELLIDYVGAMHDSYSLAEDIIKIESNQDFYIDRKSLYKVINYDSFDPEKNGSHFIVKGSHIICTSSENGINKMSLNRKQRTLLNIEQFKVREGTNTNSSMYKLKIVECEDSENSIKDKYFKTLNSWFLNFFVGKKNILLTVKRPYTIDENFDIVRMSSNNMRILGLNNMDRVILSYGNKNISVNVLENQDLNSFKQCNLDTLDYDDTKNNIYKDKNVSKRAIIDENYCILVPIHLREQLFGLSYDECRKLVVFNSCIKVSRDNKYIFMKGFYKQLIPIALAFFAVFELIPIFFPLFHNKLILALFSLFAAVLTLYLNFSEERNICN